MTENLYTVMFEPTTPRTALEPQVEDEHAATTRALRAANQDLRSRNAELERINDDLRDRLSAASEGREE